MGVTFNEGTSIVLRQTNAPPPINGSSCQSTEHLESRARQTFESVTYGTSSRNYPSMVIHTNAPTLLALVV